MNHKAKQAGFTLIELMLAMAFIAMLLLAVALMIIQVANIYNRGTLLRELNQTSRSIGKELESAMRSSSTFSLDPTAKRYVNNQWGGRLCLGQYTYVWNYGTALSAVNPNRNVYPTGAVVPNANIVKIGSTNRYEISFVKVPDSGGSYCVASGLGVYPNISPTGAVEMMRSGDHTLVLHSFGIVSTPTATDSLSGQQLYKVTYTIGTNDLNALNSTQTACKLPNVSGADPNYCSIQQFTIVLRVVNGVN
ncbi:MAG: hypothetical protein WA030_00290 [Candidatus Microsaccharimonas sp.]